MFFAVNKKGCPFFAGSSLGPPATKAQCKDVPACTYFPITSALACLLRTQVSLLLPIALRVRGSSLPSDRLMWAKIGPVGAVVAFAILIAIVCYITQTRRK